ncbi:hypothetical protein V2A60_007701 [Cordyceps javanica]
MAPHAEIAARFVDDDFGYNGFWYSTAGYAIRWSLFGLFVLIILLWVCFFPRQPRMQQAGWYRPYNAYPYGPQQDGYNMNYMPPPPTYDANRPPEYQQGPPAGASKVDPSQWSGQPTNRPAESSTTGAGVAPEYASPPGPPPAVTRQ